MMESIKIFIVNNIFSLITAIVAIVAIWQTHKQIKTSNKQFLFEKRVNKYTLVNGLMQLYKSNESILDYSNSGVNEPIIVDFQFECLTNIGFLKDITKIVYDSDNHEEKVNFLLKLEEIKKIANEINFLFRGEQGKLLKNFIYNYQNVLLELYKYQRLQNLMRNNEVPCIRPKTYEELQKEFNEYPHRKELYNAIADLKERYDEIINKNILEKVEKNNKL